MTLYVALAIILSALGLVLSVSQCAKALRKGREEAIFWVGLAFFSFMPILLDGVLSAVGMLDEFERSIIANNPFYWAGVQDETLFEAALFATCFGAVFVMTEAALRHAFGRRGTPTYVGATNSSAIINNVSFLVSSVSAVVIFSEGANYILNQESAISTSRAYGVAQLLLPMGAVATYHLAKTRRYLMALLYAAPIIAVGLGGQARAIFFYVPLAILMGHLHGQGFARPRLSRVFLFLSLLLVVAIAVKAATNPYHGFWTAEDRLLFLIASLVRDTSAGENYYIFATRDLIIGTEGASILSLMVTGLIPPFVNRDLFSIENLATFELYQLRFGDYSYGSLHPTLPGYAYFDLGYGGLVLAVFLPVAIHIFRLLVRRLPYAPGVQAVLLSGFYLVATRGSPNVGYFRLIYGSALMLIILFLATKLFRALEGRKQSLTD